MALNDNLRADLIKGLQETVVDDAKEEAKNRFDPQTNTLYGENRGDAYDIEAIRDGVIYYKFKKEKVATSQSDIHYFELAAYALDYLYRNKKEYEIDPALVSEVERFALNRNIPKGKLIEQALKFYMAFEKQKGR
ncbi:MAG: hypothetical protein K6G40_09850 [Eubacterium sp.]|nr:hypothetical protein [Eubacterium sp.]